MLNKVTKITKSRGKILVLKIIFQSVSIDKNLLLYLVVQRRNLIWKFTKKVLEDLKMQRKLRELID